MPMKFSGLELAGFRQAGDRQGRGVGGEDRIVAQERLGLGRHFGLDVAVLEHRLDDQIAAFESSGSPVAA